MRIKTWLFVFCFSLMSSVFAENRHLHPKAESKDAQAAMAQGVAKGAMLPGYCEIEVINNSFENVTVYGTFDDGTPLIPFNIYRYESPHYIDLFYYNYCHASIYLDIVTFSGYHFYSGFTPVNTTIKIVPYLTSQPKAEIKRK